MDCVAFESTPIDRYRTKADWDAEAADLVRVMLERWQLTAGEPFAGGVAASVLRVTTAEGTPAVLKVGFPHLEGVWEAVALESWGPSVAPRVLRQDASTWSLLLELVAPGTPLSTLDLPPEDGLRAAAELYRGLVSHPAPPGVVTLPEVMDVYLANARARRPGQSAELEWLDAASLLDRGLAEVEALAASDSGSAFLHGDYNPGNVLAAGGQSATDAWRVIDPKPMVGDPEFDVFPLIEQLGSPLAGPDPLRTLERRLLEFCRIVGCDPARAARWCFARSALNLSWLLEDGDHPGAATTVPELRLWRELSGL